MLNTLIIKNSAYQVEYVVDAVKRITGSKFTILGIKGLTEQAVRDGCPNRLEQKDIVDFVNVVNNLNPTASLYIFDGESYKGVVVGTVQIIPNPSIFDKKDLTKP